MAADLLQVFALSRGRSANTSGIRGHSIALTRFSGVAVKLCMTIQLHNEYHVSLSSLLDCRL